MSPRRARVAAAACELLTSKYIRGQIAAGQGSLRAAGIDPTPALLESISAYIELLLRWNRKLNLTTITDPLEILTRNFLESFFAARWLLPAAGRLCDVGSGAGFPGLALKLILPDWQITLIEPTTKRAVFLAEVARKLGMNGVEIERCRWQDSLVAPGSVDAITSRALGGYSELVKWSRTRLRPLGYLILWLGTRDAEVLTQSDGWHWQQEMVPGSRERVVLVGTPQQC